MEAYCIPTCRFFCLQGLDLHKVMAPGRFIGQDCPQGPAQGYACENSISTKLPE